jgi:hypothetical protein
MKRRLILAAAIVLAWAAYFAWQRHTIEQVIG